MKTLFALLCIFAAFAVRSLAQTQRASGPLAGFSAILDAPRSPEPSTPALTLDEIERIALAENPEIRVAARKVAMAEAHVPTTGRLDDPQFMLRNWQVPLSKPWDLNAAQNMLMLSRSLPGPGKRPLQTSIAQSDVTVAKDELEAVRLQIRVEARKAFFDLLLAQGEMRIHDQHVDIARQAIEAAQIKYTVGKVPQQDVLKAQLAMTRLEEHIIRFERDAEVARVRVNTLLGRDSATPIHVQGDFGIEADLPADRREGKRVVGYGAPGKGNTLLNFCGIRTDLLEYTVDRNPYKQGQFLPGTHIPIRHPDVLEQDRPDYVLILPWNLSDEIAAQLAHMREWGARFVVPIPEVHVL